MDKEVFDLFMKRFDGLEERGAYQHKTLTKLLEAHVTLDDKVHSTVERHATYFKLLFLGLPLVGGAVATKMGWK